MKTNRMLTLFMLLLGLSALYLMAETVDVSGDWTMKTTTPRGEMEVSLTFVQDGESLKVTMINQRGESEGTGTIKGNEIEWSVTRETPRGTRTSTFTGKVDGASMSGTTKMRGEDVEWSAVRK